jgi:shikimate kinase
MTIVAALATKAGLAVPIALKMQKKKRKKNRRFFSGLVTPFGLELVGKA